MTAWVPPSRASVRNYRPLLSGFNLRGKHSVYPHFDCNRKALRPTTKKPQIPHWNWQTSLQTSASLRLDTYGLYPKHAQAIRKWRERKAED
ncbi:MAG: hypothetical protein DMG74_03525 [Acidobacteria bacterium]|nr:MAG: hypothetical protein DMG74_03525 [Acidobacteriota bacterium]